MATYLVNNTLDVIAKGYAHKISEKLKEYKFDVVDDKYLRDVVYLSFSLDCIQQSIADFFKETGLPIETCISSLEKIVLQKMNGLYKKQYASVSIRYEESMMMSDKFFVFVFRRK